MDVLQNFFIAFVDEIGNSKTFEANLQNSSGRPVESYWMFSRIQGAFNRNSTGRPLNQMIWAIYSEKYKLYNMDLFKYFEHLLYEF